MAYNISGGNGDTRGKVYAKLGSRLTEAGETVGALMERRKKKKAKKKMTSAGTMAAVKLGSSVARAYLGGFGR